MKNVEKQRQVPEPPYGEDRCGGDFEKK